MSKILELEDLKYELAEKKGLHSAEHEEIIAGWTTDIYFLKTREILKKMGKLKTEVTAEIFPSRSGIFAGRKEALALLEHTGIEVWSLPEGEFMEKGEVVFRLKGSYGSFGLYETPLLGILASNSAWAQAARECKLAAGELPVICFGARHLHPAVAPVMERAATVGGADGISCILAARMAGEKAQGTTPHALYLIIGDTLEGALAYDRYLDSEHPRIVLVDTFKDEAEETLRVAREMGSRLEGVRLDTPGERGGVTTDLVREVRARLDQEGFKEVKIVVSGGLNPDRIRDLAEAGADAFGVGSYISGARANDMTMDIKEVEGKPVAKRGRVPGITENPRLEKFHGEK